MGKKLNSLDKITQQDETQATEKTESPENKQKSVMKTFNKMSATNRDFYINEISNHMKISCLMRYRMMILC